MEKMKIEIEVTANELGSPFFYVYEVVGVTKDKKSMPLGHYLTAEEAEFWAEHKQRDSEGFYHGVFTQRVLVFVDSLKGL